MSKDKIIKFEFLCILFLICFYNIDKIENAVHVLIKLFKLLKEFILSITNRKKLSDRVESSRLGKRRVHFSAAILCGAMYYIAIL